MRKLTPVCKEQIEVHFEERGGVRNLGDVNSLTVGIKGVGTKHVFLGILSPSGTNF